MTIPAPFTSFRHFAHWRLGLALVLTSCAHRPDPGAAVPTVPTPSSSEPVTVATLADPPTVSPGDTFQLVVRVRIASGYHIYSTKASEGSFSPTSLTFILPDELAFAGDWVFPPPIITQTGESVYRDSVLFRRQVKVQLNAVPKQLSIKGELLCQACNPDLCFPARKLPISASVAVVSKTKK